MSVDYAKFPDQLDIELKLKSSAFWPTDPTKDALAKRQAAIGANASAGKWEKVTEWRPFLALPANDPQAFKTVPFRATDLNGMLNLRRAAQEITSITYNGRTLVQGTDWRASDGVDWVTEPPYTHLEFQYPHGANTSDGAQFTNPIQITARWGFCSVLPPDVWEQCERAGALGALTSIENIQSIASISQDSFSKAFDIVGIITQKDLLAEWGKNFIQSALSYRRTV